MRACGGERDDGASRLGALALVFVTAALGLPGVVVAGERDWPELLEELRTMEEGPPESREAIVEGLTSAGSEAIPELVATMEDGSNRVARVGALEALAAMAGLTQEVGMPSVGTGDLKTILLSLAGASGAPGSPLGREARGALSLAGVHHVTVVPALVEKLETCAVADGEYPCVATAVALGAIAAEARESVLPVLVALLGNPSAATRRLAAQAIGRPRSGFEAAALPLAALLDDTDPDVRSAALAALVSLQPRDGRLAPHIVPLLRDPDPRVRADGTRLLSWLPSDSMSLDLVRGALKDESADARAWAVRALGGMEPSREIVALLEPLTSDPDPSVRGAVAAVVRGLADDVAESEPLVSSLLHDSDAQVRELATQAVGYMEAPSKGAIQKIMEDLRDGIAPYRPEDLRLSGEALTDFVPDLLALSRHPSVEVRRTAVMLLGGVEPFDDGIVVALVEALGDPHHDVAWQASRSLAGLPINRSGLVDPVLRRRVVPPILEALHREGARWGAIRALGDLELTGEFLPGLLNAYQATGDPEILWVLGTMEEGDASAVPFLMTLMKSKNSEVALKACRALASLGMTAEAALPQMISRLGDEAFEGCAVEALGRMGQSKPRMAVALLVKVLRDGESDRYDGVMWSLNLLARTRDEALPGLLEALAHPSPKVRAQALPGIVARSDKSHADERLAAVVKALDDESSSVRVVAVEVLRAFSSGPREGSARRALEYALHDQDRHVRKKARETLDSFPPAP